MKNTSVNILGTKYSIMFKNIKDDKYLKESDGYIDKTSKKIVICNKEDDNELDYFEVHQRKVLRHEIVHAFFFESGLAENIENLHYGVSETMVDWIAIQFPKIYKIFEQLNILN